MEWNRNLVKYGYLLRWITQVCLLVGCLFSTAPWTPTMALGGQSISHQELTVRSPGFVDRYGVSEGQCVKVGQSIIEMDNRLIKASLKEAQSALDMAQAQLDLAQDSSRRLNQLKDSDAITAQQLVEVRGKVAQAKAAQKQARAIMEKVQIQLDDSTIKARIEGMVTGLPTVIGLYVQPGASLGRIQAQSCKASQ